MGERMKFHDEFVPDKWASEKSVSLSEPKIVTGVFGPQDAVDFHLHRIQWRPAAKIASLKRVPADVFVWSVGEAPNRCTTRFGGIPYFRRGRTWPTNRHGEPQAFLLQVCFADSAVARDVYLPGDVMLVFGESMNRVDTWRAEWENVGIAESHLVSTSEVKCWDPQLPYFGSIWRTWNIVDWDSKRVNEMCCDDRDGWANSYAEGLGRVWGSQVSAAPFDGAYERFEADRVVGSIAPIAAMFERPWPLLNRSTPAFGFDPIAGGYLRGVGRDGESTVMMSISNQEPGSIKFTEEIL
jgi:Domain of unknown function (DUF1963)